MPTPEEVPGGGGFFTQPARVLCFVAFFTGAILVTVPAFIGSNVEILATLGGEGRPFGQHWSH